MLRTRILAAALGLVGGLWAGQAGASPPSELARKLQQRLAFQAAAAEIAQGSGRDPAVRATVSPIIAHGRRSLAQLGKALRQTPPDVPALTRTEQDDLDTLRKLSGRDFDKMYVSWEIEALDASADLANRLSQQNDDRALRRAARDILPGVTRDLRRMRATPRLFP